MNKMIELAGMIGFAIALACAVIAAIATTGTVATATLNIFQGFVAVMIVIFIIGAALITDESRKKKKQIDYRKMSTT